MYRMDEPAFALAWFLLAFLAAWMLYNILGD